MFIFTNIYFQRYILVREWEERGCRSFLSPTRFKQTTLRVRQVCLLTSMFIVFIIYIRNRQSILETRVNVTNEYFLKFRQREG